MVTFFLEEIRFAKNMLFSFAVLLTVDMVQSR